MKALFTKSFFFSIATLFFLQAKAQWSTTANVDNALNAKLISTFNMCSDGHGGAIYTWDTTDCCGHRTVYANRIDSLGFLRWGTKGISLHHDTVALHVLPSPSICEDGKGGCYIVYLNNNPASRPAFCQHLDANGNKLWGTNGKQVTTAFTTQSYQNEPSVINDNGKGVFVIVFTNASSVIAGLYAQRLNFNGAKQWGANGKLIEQASDIRLPKAIADGNNGIFVTWTNYTFDGLGHQFQIRMNRFTHNGAARFTSGNKKINTIEAIGFGPFYRLMLTKQKKVLIAWLKDASGTKLYTQKIDSLGNFLWGTNEISVCDTSAGFRSTNNILTDGGEGAYYVWLDSRKSGFYGAYMQHLNSAGAKTWKSQGVQIDSNAAGYAPYLSVDINNGVKVFWIDNTSGNLRAYLQQLNKNGIKQIPGLGTAVSAVNHSTFNYVSVVHASNNHDILFLKDALFYCYAKYIPFNSILPVALLNFTVENNGTKNIISWQTVSEINTNYFSVERSDNRNNFYEIERQKANNSQSINNYAYADAGISHADVYYRLKSVDADGSFTYSKVISIHQNNNTSFKIIPNPAAINCIIYFDAVAETNSAIKIFDHNGNLQKQILLAPKQAQVSLNVSSFTPGTYFCRIESTGKILTQKLIVVK
jgi:type IX secretion system substrate protein